MTTDADLYRPAPMRSAGGMRFRPEDEVPMRTARTERQARDIYGESAIQRPAVFDEVADYQRWADAGQPLEECYGLGGVITHVSLHTSPPCSWPSPISGYAKANIDWTTVKAVNDLATDLGKFIGTDRGVAFDSIARMLRGLVKDGASGRPRRSSKAERARKVAAVQAARGNSTGPKDRPRPPKELRR